MKTTSKKICGNILVSAALPISTTLTVSCFNSTKTDDSDKEAKLELENTIKEKEKIISNLQEANKKEKEAKLELENTINSKEQIIKEKDKTISDLQETNQNDKKAKSELENTITNLTNNNNKLENELILERNKNTISEYESALLKTGYANFIAVSNGLLVKRYDNLFEKSKKQNLIDK
ncbi:UNVERIFIED_CONTAM: hypothetical protein O8I53_13880 [Campylobacter lari]